MSYELWSKRCSIEDFKGIVFDKIKGEPGDEEIKFYENGQERFRMYHSQDCCESVSVDDICGDLSDLIGSPIVEAEEVSSDNEGAKSQYTESYTWTFYKLGTIKGSVTIRWYGESNGYYSESVDIADMKKEVAN